MVVHPVAGNVCKMKVRDVTSQLADQLGRVFAHAVKVPDVEVEPDMIRADVSHELFELVRVFDEQAGLWLNQNAHIMLFRRFCGFCKAGRKQL